MVFFMSDGSSMCRREENLNTLMLASLYVMHEVSIVELILREKKKKEREINTYSLSKLLLPLIAFFRTFRSLETKGSSLMQYIDESLSLAVSPSSLSLIDPTTAKFSRCLLSHSL